MLLRAAALSACTLLTACISTGPATLALPPDLTAAETSEAELPDFGKRRTNSFAALGYSGESRWTAGRVAWGDSHIRTKTTVTTTLSGADGEARNAHCTSEKKAYGIEIAKIPFDIAYKEPALLCRIENAGGTVDGALLLRSDKYETGRFVGTGRAGFIRIGAESWDITSMHQLVETAFRPPAPLGYKLTSDGRTMAVINMMTAEAKVVLPAALTAEERERAMLAAVILATFVDPEGF